MREGGHEGGREVMREVMREKERSRGGPVFAAAPDIGCDGLASGHAVLGLFAANTCSPVSVCLVSRTHARLANLEMQLGAA